MKILILALALTTTFGVAAQVNVNPNIIIMGNTVQVQIHNSTEFNVSCSGSVYMHTTKGGTETGYYFDQIQKGSFSMRSFYLMNTTLNNRITFTSHSIFCNKVR
jgi:hypothetical protein